MKTRSKKDIIRENETLRRICANFQWMARRYADGRSTYAVSMLNDNTYLLLNMGVQLTVGAEKKIFAQDGMFGLSQEYIDLEKEYILKLLNEQGDV